MSIIFGTTLSEITGFTLTCGHDNGVTEHRFGTYEEARTVLQAEYDTHGHTGGFAVCDDDYCLNGMMSVLPMESDPAPDLNVSNTNAMHLLGLLGLPSEPDECGTLSGSTTAEDFLGRVLLAQAINPADAGVPATSTAGQGGTVLIDMGRRLGYADERLTTLRELADFAVSRDRDVQWC